MSVVLAVVGVAPARAATFSVGDGAALVSAIASAGAQSGPSTIELRGGAYAPSSTLTISGDVTIAGPTSGPGADVSGDAIAPTGSDLFSVAPGGRATFENLILSSSGYENEGAAVDDGGSVFLEDSTLSGNDGPALVVEPGATATATDTTISAGIDGGIEDTGSATLVNSTVADNQVLGIEDSSGKLSLVNTIVADNGGRDCTAPAASSDDSLDSDGSCGVGALSAINPQLEPLSANGGPTLTQALAAGSAAIGAGDPGQCPSLDQRGYQRPSGRPCDIGAYQTGAVPGAGASPGDSGPGASSTNPSGTGPQSPGGGGGTSGASKPSPRRVIVGLVGHGWVHGSRRSTASFAIDVRVSHPHGTLTYRDAAAGVSLTRASVSSVSVDTTRGRVSVSGTAIIAGKRRRVRFVAIATDLGSVRSLTLRLSSGYFAGGRLVRGTLADVTHT